MLRLHLTDSAYTDRLAAFLHSVGLRPTMRGPGSVEVGDVERADLELYLGVWRVLHPDAAVELEEG